MKRVALVVTSISGPSPILRELAAGCRDNGVSFYLIGDVASPPDFALDGCNFYSLSKQKNTGYRFAEVCPTRHYARKNIGYLLAMQQGAEIIIETDDDNSPLPGFWAERRRRQTAPAWAGGGWVNAYNWFSDANVWPRGLPLDAVQRAAPPFESLSACEVDAPIQQALADENPDVDAIYRLTSRLPIYFRTDRKVALGAGAWCPFNSQNTGWWFEAYPLLYLPAHCSFRMTDIWRSFVAQRVAWTNGWSVLFTAPTVRQMRNDHQLMRDFRDELPGYLNNRRIGELLESLNLQAGPDHIHDNLRICYEMLVREGFIGQEELACLNAWLSDFDGCRRGLLS